MKNMFSLRSSSYDLRGNYILSLSKPKTTTYGLNSFSYFSAKQWTALPDFFRTSFLQTLRLKYRALPFLKFSFVCFFLLLIIVIIVIIIHNVFNVFSSGVSSKILASKLL